MDNDPKLEVTVKYDILCHRENGVDLNPYSTVGARDSWDRGFKGKLAWITTDLSAYKRGQMAAKLIKEQA